MHSNINTVYNINQICQGHILIPKSLKCLFIYALSGFIGKVVASHAAVARSSPAEVALIYTMQDALRGYCP